METDKGERTRCNAFETKYQLVFVGLMNDAVASLFKFVRFERLLDVLPSVIVGQVGDMNGWYIWD